MNTKATAKFIRISPRKVRLVVDLVRGLSIEEARNQLTFSSKLAAKPVLKVLNSAVANAENNENVDTTAFVIKEAFVDEGPTIKRFTPRAQGRATMIRKRMSHITISVGPGESSKKEKVEKEATQVEKKPKTKKEDVKKTADAVKK